MPTKRTLLKLTFEQETVAASFYDFAVDDPSANFEQATKRLLGKEGFTGAQNAAAFRREGRKEFDIARAK